MVYKIKEDGITTGTEAVYLLSAGATDNWALIYSQSLALKHCVPLVVCFCLVPKFLEATIRHYHFMLEGLKEVEKVCVCER